MRKYTLRSYYDKGEYDKIVLWERNTIRSYYKKGGYDKIVLELECEAEQQ